MNTKATNDYGMAVLIIGATNMKDAIEMANTVTKNDGRVYVYDETLKYAKFTGKKAKLING